MNYPRYFGLDVSVDAIERAKKVFRKDTSKQFAVVSAESEPSWRSFKADLSLSLDVIYHLVEDVVFEAYMHDLFEASAQFVIVYSSNDDRVPETHVRHRKFSSWVDAHAPDWTLIKTIPNRFPFDPEQPDETSKADFFIYQKLSSR